MATLTRLLPLLLALLLGACSTATGPLARQPSALPTATPARPPVLLASTSPLGGLIDSLYRQPASLWQQLRDELALPVRDDKRVRQQLAWYSKHPSYLDRVVKRAQPYLWYIRDEVRRRGMPGEIALLPIVESAYDPFAYSHGRAAGLWQFIPGTGRRFGLKQNWWYDGRRDLIDSTRAALDYLELLHRRFKGDWLLALAAYNSGEGTVMSAVRRNRKKGRPTDFWHLKLPRETRAYVPKLLALAELVRAPGARGVTLPPVPNEPYFDIVGTGGQIDLAIAADLMELPLDDLYRLNPGFNQWATDPSGPHRLLVPRTHRERFEEALAGLPADRRVKWVRHKVRKGETLSHIARRYHTTTGALQSANNLRSHRIRAGHHLLVPVAASKTENYRLSAAQRRASKQNRARSGSRRSYTVRRGDTLWDIARAHKVGVRSLASWNSMAPGDPLKVGQRLVIWSKSGRSSHPGSRTRTIHYTVRRGDSLSRISSRFRVSVADLRRWNRLPKGRYLKPGQRLKLYVDVTRQAGSS
ncbi:MAG TPA: LysM peptidoglycan-binding domain-containing protein [Gammaproteobacteria bacterium]|nr:LysM peptidoglycan-binding domain-containing protein [Gammaproteobacteria bacterium]